MKKWHKVALMGLVVVGVTAAFTPVAMALFNFGAILGMVVSAVVGVVVGAVTLNPGAGMAAAMITCVLVCSSSGSGSNNGNTQNPPTSSPRGAVCNSFTASPTTLEAPGGNVTFSWDTARANRVRILPEIGSVPASGTRTIYVDETGPYKLEAMSRVYDDCERTITITVTEPLVDGPDVTLEAQSPSAGIGWSGNGFTVVTGNTVELQWEVSDDAESCESTNFTWGNDFDGETTPIKQPTGSEEVTYVLTCVDEEGDEGIDRITIKANDVAPTLTASKTTVRLEEPFTLDWQLNGNDPAGCVLTGPGSNFSATGSITGDDSDTIEAVGTATYTLDCGGGDDSVEINVLPQIYES